MQMQNINNAYLQKLPSAIISEHSFDWQFHIKSLFLGKNSLCLY